MWPPRDAFYTPAPTQVLRLYLVTQGMTQGQRLAASVAEGAPHARCYFDSAEVSAAELRPAEMLKMVPQPEMQLAPLPP